MVWPMWCDARVLNIFSKRFSLLQFYCLFLCCKQVVRFFSISYIFMIYYQRIKMSWQRINIYSKIARIVKGVNAIIHMFCSVGEMQLKLPKNLDKLHMIISTNATPIMLHYLSNCLILKPKMWKNGWII